MMLALIRHILSVHSFATIIVFQLLHQFVLYGAAELVYVAVTCLPQNIISMLMQSILY